MAYIEESLLELFGILVGLSALDCSYKLQCQKELFLVKKNQDIFEMSEDCLSSLSVKNIEVYILLKLDSKKIITNFVTKKVRQKCFSSSSKTLFIYVNTIFK